MTLEEKLARFSETLAKETQKQSDKAVDDYKRTLEKNLKLHKEEAIRHADLQVSHAYSSAKKDKIKFLANAKLNIKRTIKKRSNELKEKLYSETLEELIKFKSSDKYLYLINNMIKKIDAYSKNEDVIILIDKSDIDIKDKIQSLTNHKVDINSTSIIGGICGYIPKNKVLLNLSFSDRLNIEIENFDFSKEGLDNE